MHKRWLSTLVFAALCASGCTGIPGAIWGNLAVFGMSVGIFMGTLSLGRGR